jgi:beta-phosphoglucomutase-like phosphatase (HAD superfamily)
VDCGALCGVGGGVGCKIGCDAACAVDGGAGCDAGGVGRFSFFKMNSLCCNTLSERPGNGFLLARQGPAMTRATSIPDNPHVPAIRGFNQFDNDSFENEKIAIFYELLKDGGLQPYPIIKNILYICFPDTPAYIISSQNAELVNRLLEVWKLNNRFLGIYTTDGAPSKEGTIRAIIEANSYIPQSVAFFDDVRENLVTAKKLGLYCVGIRDAYNQETLKSTDADILIFMQE